MKLQKIFQITAILMIILGAIACGLAIYSAFIPGREVFKQSGTFHQPTLTITEQSHLSPSNNPYRILFSTTNVFSFTYSITVKDLQSDEEVFKSEGSRTAGNDEDQEGTVTVSIQIPQENFEIQREGTYETTVTVTCQDLSRNSTQGLNVSLRQNVFNLPIEVGLSGFCSIFAAVIVLFISSIIPVAKLVSNEKDQDLFVRVYKKAEAYSDSNGLNYIIFATVFFVFGLGAFGAFFVFQPPWWVAVTGGGFVLASVLMFSIGLRDLKGDPSIIEGTILRKYVTTSTDDNSTTISSRNIVISIDRSIILHKDGSHTEQEIFPKPKLSIETLLDFKPKMFDEMIIQCNAEVYDKVEEGEKVSIVRTPTGKAFARVDDLV